MATKSRNLSIDSFNASSIKLQGIEAMHFGEYYDTIYGIVLYYYNGFIVETYYNQETNCCDGMKAISIDEAAEKYVNSKQVFG